MVKAFVLLYLIIFLPLFAEAQEKKEVKRLFLEAEYFFLMEEYREAAFIYSELLKTEPFNFNLNFLAGASYLSIPGETQKALPFLEKAVQGISPGYREGNYREENAPAEALFALAKAYHILGRFKEAKEYYDTYYNAIPIYHTPEIEYTRKQMRDLELAVKMLQETNDLPLQALFEASLPLNEPYNAVFAEGDSTLLFMSDKPFFSAVYMTKYRKGAWTLPEIINGDLRLDDNLRLCYITESGKDLFISCRIGYQKDIFVSRFEDGKWQPAMPLSAINTEFNENFASVSKEGNRLFFSSDRPGGEGALDIYYSEKNTNGEWSSAVNLGKPVNGIYSEDSPVLTAEGDALFFTSISHPSVGGYDIYRSEALPTATWSYPANLGPPLNTTADDVHFFPLDNGKQAILNFPGENKDLYGLYIASLEPSDPDQKFTFTGSLSTSNNSILEEKPNLSLKNTKTGDSLRLTTLETTGNSFSFNLEEGDYEILISSPGFDDKQEFFSVKGNSGAGFISMESELQESRSEKNQFTVLARNILFGFDSERLNKAAKIELEKLLRVMKEQPEIYVELKGRTDSKGSESYNLLLANRRINSVVDYLTTRGISRERFLPVALGDKENLAINRNPDGSDNPEGRRFNRQVEISLIHNQNVNIRLEETRVPEHLLPEALKSYFVLYSREDEANKSDFEPDTTFRLMKQGEEPLYIAGPFQPKTEALDLLSGLKEVPGWQPEIITRRELEHLRERNQLARVSREGPFTLQFLALKKRNPGEGIKQPGEYLIIPGEDGYYRYLVGVFQDKDLASPALSRLVEQGYHDAFLGKLSDYGRFKNADPQIESQGYYYTIQVMALDKNNGSTRLPGVDLLMIEYGRDGLRRYYSGLYTSMDEGRNALSEIRSSGYKDAFIKKIAL